MNYASVSEKTTMAAFGTLNGERVDLTPTGLGGPFDGILQPAYRDDGR